MSDETDDLDARIIARAAHLLAPPPPTPEQRIAALEAELARERAAWLCAMRRGNDALREVCRERDQLRAQVLELEADLAQERARSEASEARVREL